MEEFDIVDLIFLIIIIVTGIIVRFINWIKLKIKQSKISYDEFDEFTDIETIKKQQLKEKQELEYEHQVLKQVYSDAYSDSLREARNDRNRYRYIENGYQNDIGNYDRLMAHRDAQKTVEEVKRDLYNFKVIDAVEVEEDISEGNPINVLRENGYNFDIGLFKKWSRQIFGCIKSGTEEQLKIVKQFMSESLYGRLEKQRKSFAKDGLEFVTEDLIIEKCCIYDYGKSMSKEEIKILINATMKEYIIQKETGEILRGNNKKTYNKNILMTFEKQNTENSEGLIHNCPNCGAEVAQTEFGKCRYCSTLVVPIRYNWTLTKFETL